MVRPWDFVTYTNVSRRESFGVKTTTLSRFGAVSEQTAREMGRGRDRHSHAQVALAITGIAGPEWRHAGETGRQLLAIAYTEAYQATGKTFLCKYRKDIFNYVLRDMTSPEGVFYSAEDADSERIEGKFYVWTPDEVLNILGERDSKIFCDYYDVSNEGNYDEKECLTC